MARAQLSSYAIGVTGDPFSEPGPWPGTFLFPLNPISTTDEVWSDDDPGTTAGYNNSFNPRSAGVVIDNAVVTIPPTATIDTVSIYAHPDGVVAMVGEDHIDVFAIESSSKTLSNGRDYGVLYDATNAEFPGVNVDIEFVLPLAPGDLAWTPALIDSHIFGFKMTTVTFEHSTKFAAGEVGVFVDFTMVPPTVATGTARSSGLVAILRAFVDPQGATAAFPVTVRFRYGTQVDESDWIDGPVCAAENGSGNRQVGNTISEELVSGQTYYFRAYADYADGTVIAANISSFTPIQEDRILGVL